MSTEIFMLIAFWCAPLGTTTGASHYSGEMSQFNYARVQDCRIRLRNCLHEGGGFNYESKLETCLYDKHPEEPAK
jgi:hypothetical protein